MNPLDYRPHGDTVDWEDNRLSNLLAWSSKTFSPRWCQTPEHWTAKISGYLWTDCPCCAFFRGAAFGALPAAVTGFVLGWLL